MSDFSDAAFFVCAQIVPTAGRSSASIFRSSVGACSEPTFLSMNGRYLHDGVVIEPARDRLAQGRMPYGYEGDVARCDTRPQDGPPETWATPFTV